MSESKETNVMSATQQKPEEQLKAFIAVRGALTRVRRWQADGPHCRRIPTRGIRLTASGMHRSLRSVGRARRRVGNASRCVSSPKQHPDSLSTNQLYLPQLMMHSTAMFSAMQVCSCTIDQSFNSSYIVTTGTRFLLRPTDGPRSDTHRMSAHTSIIVSL